MAESFKVVTKPYEVAGKPGHVLVRLHKNFRANKKGDVCGQPAEKAAHFVAKGAAEYVEPLEKPKADKADKAEK